MFDEFSVAGAAAAVVMLLIVVISMVKNPGLAALPWSYKFTLLVGAPVMAYVVLDRMSDGQ